MMDDTHVMLAHGNGGRLMRCLIEDVLMPHFANSELDVQADAAAVAMPFGGGSLVVTTDGFTVQPLEFPNGNIGSLAVHGTINDLAVSGASPLYMTVAFMIEEGFEIAVLERVAASLGRAARDNNIAVIAGDTKVVGRGEGGGLYIVTTGIGVRAIGIDLGMKQVRDGDCILLSGPVGDHGISVLLAREEFSISGKVQSDCASVARLAQALLPLPDLRFMRDPTRGGLATVAHELCRGTGFGIALRESAIPIRAEVRSVCDMLGYDPLYLACEGRVVAVVSADGAAAALNAWRSLPEGREAEVIGNVASGQPCVVLKTKIGGERFLDELEDDPLPRIC